MPCVWLPAPGGHSRGPVCGWVQVKFKKLGSSQLGGMQIYGYSCVTKMLCDLRQVTCPLWASVVSPVGETTDNFLCARKVLVAPGSRG